MTSKNGGLQSGTIRELRMTGGAMAASSTYTLAAVCTSLALLSSSARAADVTYQRLLNPEPQNWLMNHHDFSSQRFSTLQTINRSNVKNLKLAFSVALGG